MLRLINASKNLFFYWVGCFYDVFAKLKPNRFKISTELGEITFIPLTYLY